MDALRRRPLVRPRHRRVRPRVLLRSSRRVHGRMPRSRARRRPPLPQRARLRSAARRTQDSGGGSGTTGCVKEAESVNTSSHCGRPRPEGAHIKKLKRLLFVNRKARVIDIKQDWCNVRNAKRPNGEPSPASGAFLRYPEYQSPGVSPIPPCESKYANSTLSKLMPMTVLRHRGRPRRKAPEAFDLRRNRWKPDLPARCQRSNCTALPTTNYPTTPTRNRNVPKYPLRGKAADPESKRAPTARPRRPPSG